MGFLFIDDSVELVLRLRQFYNGVIPPTAIAKKESSNKKDI
jgi:hypothetical protein